MHQTQSFKEKSFLFIKILWPILVTQVGLYTMKLFDTMMSGQAGADDLAGVAIATSLWILVFHGINGILMAVTPIVSQLIGGGKHRDIAESVTQALYLSMLLAVTVVAAGVLFLEPILSVMHLETSVHHIAKHYLIGVSFGIIPLFAANVLRYFFDAQGYTRIMMTIMSMVMPFNIALNYVLIFGKFGFPRMGGIGAGYATGVTYWLILIISVVITFRVKAMREHRLFVKWFSPSVKAWKEQLAIGVPMGLSIFFEVSIFTVVTLLIGTMFSTETIAAHQAAYNFTSLLFMMPLSISMALTILVGFELGAKRFADAKQYSRLGVIAAMGLMAVVSIFLFVFREEIARLYTDNPEVIALLKQFLIFAIFYQISDAAQVSLQGVLRGYKDVTVPFVTALISYWLIGMPAGYGLASFTGLGPFGFWLGITIGLTGAAIGFFLRLFIIQKRRTANLSNMAIRDAAETL
ncbi:MATE family multidrug resistance protein [Melghirimyces profundicolus]|uniref:Probable multidrug resistance protein NorM n=1 Tax=Melghirimyces profundicolus TaxID=1242148 RepID=A0A2T6AYK6_9BACL|nr:MATE family efflux transporter [Melghirimyces profundicolus]PTX48887.1 MATE family multidrug resistance protein [Melghirimyces profundicolus]